MKRGTNDVFLQRHFLITTTGRTDSPRDARSVELANFQWKLVQRYEVFFGLWTIPILIVLVGVAIFIEYKWPDFYEKYLR